MTTWQITIKCILCCSMRSQMRWKKSKNRISVMPKTSSSPPSKRQKKFISPQNPKSGGERSNAAPSAHHPPKGGERSNAAAPTAVRRQTAVTRAPRSRARLQHEPTRRRLVAKPRTPHLHCAARAVLQSANCQCRGSRGPPLAFSWGSKGAILSRERMAPFVASPARCREHFNDYFLKLSLRVTDRLNTR